ncbi:U95 protein [macacine betaherpesvirus 9]|uniref:U95 protein n=1 Tax=macacine betaherpesvirus 9 TaxID=2560568 RepID=A0A192XNK1_9BETA|nr:U95 protein [macacine betaherpesvirus 9]ANC96521.1 U95 protein [macacine betaherpesvirus 9]
MENGDNAQNNTQDSLNSETIQCQQYSSAFNGFACPSRTSQSSIDNGHTYIETVLTYPLYNASSMQLGDPYSSGGPTETRYVTNYINQSSEYTYQNEYFQNYQNSYASVPSTFSGENLRFGANVIRPTPYRNESLYSEIQECEVKPCIRSMQLHVSQPSAFQNYNLLNENNMDYSNSSNVNDVFNTKSQENMDSMLAPGYVDYIEGTNFYMKEMKHTEEIQAQRESANYTYPGQQNFTYLQTNSKPDTGNNYDRDSQKILGKNNFNDGPHTSFFENDINIEQAHVVDNSGELSLVQFDVKNAQDQVSVESENAVKNQCTEHKDDNNYNLASITINNNRVTLQDLCQVNENMHSICENDVDLNLGTEYNSGRYRTLKPKITPTMGNIKYLNFDCKMSTEDEKKTFFIKLKDLLKTREDMKKTKIFSSVVEQPLTVNSPTNSKTFVSDIDLSDTDTDVLAENPLVICENELSCSLKSENQNVDLEIENKDATVCVEHAIKRNYPEICPGHFKKRRYINGDLIYQTLNSCKSIPVKLACDESDLATSDCRIASSHLDKDRNLILLSTNLENPEDKTNNRIFGGCFTDTSQNVYNCSNQRQGKRLLADIPYRPWLKEKIPTDEYGKRFIHTAPRPPSVFVFGKCRKAMLRDSSRSFNRLNNLQYTKESLESYVLRNCNKFLILSWPVKHRIYIMPDVSKNYNVEFVRSLFPVPDGWIIVLGVVGTEEPMAKIYNIVVLLCENGWVLVHKNDTEEHKLYLAASNLKEFVEEGLSRCDCIFYEKSVPYGIVIEGKLKQLMENFDSLQNVIKCRKYLHGFMWAFNGAPGRLSDRVLHTCVPGFHNAVPLDTVIKFNDKPLYFFGYVTTTKQQSDLDANVLVAVDEDLIIYGYHPMSQKTWFLTKTFFAFLKMGTRKIYYDYEIPLKNDLEDSESFMASLEEAPCLMLKPEVFRRLYPKP